MLKVEPVLSLEAITVLEPTATKIPFPYAMEYKFVVTVESGLVSQLVPLSGDFISVPPLPTEKNKLLPKVIPFNVLPDAPDVREVQLEPFADSYTAPSAPQATKVEFPNATSLRIAVVIVVQFDPLSVDRNIFTFPTAAKTLLPFATP